MLLTFEEPIALATGHDPVAVHLPNNDIFVFYTRDNMLYYKQSNTGQGVWSNLVWSTESVACPAPGAVSISNKYWSGTYTWFTWTASGDQQIAMFPIPIFQMNAKFFKGFMVGLTTASQLKGSVAEYVASMQQTTADKDPDYFNGLLLGLTAVQGA
jgi:hypothetical protein